jgi:hypothetical protein
MLILDTGINVVVSLFTVKNNESAPAFIFTCCYGFCIRFYFRDNNPAFERCADGLVFDPQQKICAWSDEALRPGCLVRSTSHKIRHFKTFCDFFIG